LRYIKGTLHSNPVFKQYIQNEYREKLDLTNNISIEVMACSFRSIRGRSVVCAIFDEVAFWRVEGANPDKEILSAIRPAMATIPNSKLVVISSPYARFGVLYEIHRDYFGKDDPDILVWKAPTTVMNPTIEQKFIDKESVKDPSAAASEWYAEFRQDIESYIGREQLEAVTVYGRYELPPVIDTTYKAFVDPSGGSRDSFTLAIGHFDSKDNVRVLDCIRERKPPFSPESVVKEFSDTLKSYGLSSVTGDRYAGEWPREQFQKCGISYQVASKPKSDIYRDLLPLLMSGKVELLDHRRLFQQLLNLERRTSRAGKDSIDHGHGGFDDIANSVAGCLTSFHESPEIEITSTDSTLVEMIYDPDF
jgi:hypothetical protein